MKRIIIFLTLLSFFEIIFAENLSESIIKISKNSDGQKLFEEISEWNNYSIPDSIGVIKHFENVINDSLKAPFYLYIPQKYDVKNRTPLIIYLHGGIGRKDFPDDFKTYIKENRLFDFAQKNNWFILYPNANLKTFWWKSSGMKNISEQIRFLKNKFNLDDNQIFLTGFSDGGSGTFSFALSKPDDFASFYPQNGNILVGNSDAKRAIYLGNLSNRFLSAINTNNDQLYPSKNMRKLYKTALDAEANLIYTEYWGIGHRDDYWETAFPNLIDLMKTHPRTIFRPQIYWECADVDYGKCDWIEITKLDTTKIKQDWQIEYSTKLVDDRLSFGYFPDRNFNGVGDRVFKVEKNSLAEKMGLLKGDIITKFDGKAVVKSSDIFKYKKETKRGNKVTLEVMRNDTKVELSGEFPPPAYYEAFRYYKSSGAVKAVYFGNEFDIQTSRVKQIAIYINPKMVNMEIPVVINIDGNEVFNKKINIDKNFMLNNFMKNKDRKAIWTNKIILPVK